MPYLTGLHGKSFRSHTYVHTVPPTHLRKRWALGWPCPATLSLPIPNKKLGTVYIRLHDITENGQILNNDQTRWDDNFDRVQPAPPPAPGVEPKGGNIFCDRNADARSVCCNINMLFTLIFTRSQACGTRRQRRPRSCKMDDVYCDNSRRLFPTLRGHRSPDVLPTVDRFRPIALDNTNTQASALKRCEFIELFRISLCQIWRQR